MRLVAERARFQKRDFEAGVGQQMLNFAGSVLAIVPRIGGPSGSGLSSW